MSAHVFHRRIWIYIITGVGLTLAYSALRGNPWQGGATLHTVMESMATLLAFVVGAMALVRFYAHKDLIYLFVGIGFLGTGVLDGYHAVVTSEYFKPMMPSDLPALIPWSWVASRLFLSIFMVLSGFVWWQEERLGKKIQVDEQSVYTFSALFTLAALLFFAFVPLPMPHYPDGALYRPGELVPAVFFLFALVGYLKKGDWKHDVFEHWLVLSLIVGFVSQAVFMSFSGELFDFEFDAAHALKKASYLCVLTGLFFSMYTIFRREEEIVRELDFQKRAIDQHSIVSIADVRGDITYVNPKFCEISGFSVEELLGQNHRMLNSGEHPRAMFVDLWRTISSGKVWNGEIKNKKKDGSYYWVDATIIPFLNEKGIPFQYVSIRTDITAHKDDKIVLQRSKEELEQYVLEINSARTDLQHQAEELIELAENEAFLNEKLKYEADVKDKFFSIIAHDLKSPFTALLGMTQLMAHSADKMGQEKLVEFAGNVHESGQRVFELVQNLLEWSRVQMEGGNFEPENLVLQTQTEECCEILRPVAEEKNIALTNKVNTETVFADRDMVQTVIRNLVANSLKFTPSGGRIDVMSQNGGDMVQVTVADTGVGMSEDQAKNVFALDQKTSTVGTNGEAGTGLGLPLCKDMLERNGGDIWVESIPGEGTQFHFSLPSGHAENSK